MIINKYNVAKGTATSEGVQSSGVIYSSSGSSSEISQEAKRLSETHLIFGQPFNGTQNVAGDINNAQNINASGGDLTIKANVTDEGTDGGNINADGDITAGNNVIGKKFIGDVEADNITANSGNITSLKGTSLEYDNADIKKAVIDVLLSENITTERLTVTKQAHFFELIIDKIKAAGGAILLTPADGFKVDLVIEFEEYYKVMWKADDGSKAIRNMWKAGDQAICQTFNQATVGASSNIANKYYWGLVTDAGFWQDQNDTNFNYICISKEDYDGELNPEIGDEIAMLGYRGTDDAERQSAIYLAAYSSIDPSLTAPLICQYKGINDFNLSNHKHSFFAANGSEIRGNLKLESGQAVEDYVDYQAVTIVGQLVEYAVSSSGTVTPTSGWATTIPYVPPANFLWCRTTVTYSDGTDVVSYAVARSGANGAKGTNGTDGADGNSYSGNLLYNTQNFDGDNWVNKSYWTDTNETYLGCKVLKREANAYGLYQDFYAEAGVTYTFSAYIKSDGGDIRYYFNVSGGGTVTPQNKDVPESNSWVRQAVTFKCTESGIIRCRIQKATGTGAVYVAGYKLEVGENTNTVWTPAPTEMIGKDADFYKLEPLRELATVDSEGNLTIDIKYQIVHIVGSSASIITATSKDYFVVMKDKNQTNTLDFSDTPSFYQKNYQTDYPNNTDRIDYFVVMLVKGDEIFDTRTVAVTLAAKATFEITDKIISRVQNTETKVGEIENNVSTLTQTAEGLTSIVESHTIGINGNKDSISKLEQTAENIQLQVNEVSLQVNEKKIILDGDTEVNGAVTINKDGTGFRLNGSEGETFSIGSDDIGTYSDFESKTIYNWWHTLRNSVYYNSVGTNVTETVTLSSLCTNLNLDQRLRITNLYLKTTDYNFSTTSLSSVSIGVYYGSPENNSLVYSVMLQNINPTNGYWYQGSSGFNGNKAALIDYTATRQGEYYVKVTVEIKGTLLELGQGITQQQHTDLDIMLGCEISLSAFGNLTYNGFGFNFGGGKIAFIGDDSMIFKMGSDAGLKITNSGGLQRLVPESYSYSSTLQHYVNSNSWIGVNDYVVRIVQDIASGSNKGTIDLVSPKDEMMIIKSVTNSIIMVLPSASNCAGKSYIIKNRSASDNVFVSGGSLQTTSAAGNIIQYNGNSGFNDSCTITTAAGNTVYRQLMKCYKHSHRLISDGEKWIDCLLSN